METVIMPRGRSNDDESRRRRDWRRRESDECLIAYEVKTSDLRAEREAGTPLLSHGPNGGACERRRRQGNTYKSVPERHRHDLELTANLTLRYLAVALEDEQTCSC